MLNQEANKEATPPPEHANFLANELTTTFNKLLVGAQPLMKVTKRSQIAVALLLFSLLWFGMEWELAGPRTFREISIDQKKGRNKTTFIQGRRSNANNNNNTRNMIGSWQANTWIPPGGWNYVSVTQMQQLYVNKTLLWLGDSLARRASLTWSSLLHASNPQDVSHFSLESPGIIDVTKDDDEFECPLHLNATHRPSICRLDTNCPFLLVRKKCWTHVLQFLYDERQKPEIVSAHDVDLIVVAAGTWDIDVKMVCRLDDYHPMSGIIDKVILYLDRVASSRTRVVVRTTAYSDWGPERAAEVDEMNDLLMNSIDQKNNPFLTYIHWGGAMKPRALSPYRIAGDNKAHFGVEGRLVLIHMLTNHLLDVGFFES